MNINSLTRVRFWITINLISWAGSILYVFAYPPTSIDELILLSPKILLLTGYFPFITWQLKSAQKDFITVSNELGSPKMKV